jgi:hypothetical protein
MAQCEHSNSAMTISPSARWHHIKKIVWSQKPILDAIIGRTASSIITQKRKVSFSIVTIAHRSYAVAETMVDYSVRLLLILNRSSKGGCLCCEFPLFPEIAEVICFADVYYNRSIKGSATGDVYLRLRSEFKCFSFSSE